MGKYFWLRCKGLGRFLPGAFLVVLVLLGSLLGAYGMMVSAQADSDENQIFEVALVGYTEDRFLQMGLSALEAFDSTRFSIHIVQMDESSAQKALGRGQIAAYVVIPEGFIDEAMGGNILPLKFVSTTGAAGLVSIFKDEITSVITQLLMSSQKGVFGMAEAARDNGQNKGLGKKMDDMSLRYAEYVFSRDKTYSLVELGIADELGLAQYLLCGLGVLFLMLVCLPFAPLMITGDHALGQMLASRGCSAVKQSVCDLGAYTLVLAVMLLCVLGVAAVFRPAALTVWQLLSCLPAVIMVASLSFMLYRLSGDLIGGVLLQFFAAVSLCFVSGCMYPVYVFPLTVQKLAAWLPTGLARTQLAGIVTGEGSLWTAAALLGYSILFFGVGSFAHSRRIKGVSR